MNWSNLKQQCLKAMGLTPWQRPDYLIAFAQEDRHFDVAKKQLIARMMHALGWPKEKTKYFFLSASDHVQLNQTLVQQIQQSNISKVLIFGMHFAPLINRMQHAVPIVVVPSLSQIMHDKLAKKQAWLHMQTLI